MDDIHVWVVRVPKGEGVIDRVISKGMVAIRFGVTESIKNIFDKESIKDLYRSNQPEATEYKVGSAAGQLYRFAHEISVNDIVLTPDRVNRTVLLGKLSVNMNLFRTLLKKVSRIQEELIGLASFHVI